MGGNASFDSLDWDHKDALAILLRNTIDNTLLAVVKGLGTEEAQAMLELLKNKGSKTDRQHKLMIVDRMHEMLNNRSGSNNTWIAGWHKVITNLKWVDVATDELF